MEQTIITLGLLGENCYCLAGQSGALVIDPGANDARIAAFCRTVKGKETAILLTHAHVDHLAGVAKLVEEFHWPVWIGEAEAPFLNDPTVNLANRFHTVLPRLPIDRRLKDGEAVSVGDLTFQVLATPGHTVGSVCYWFPKEGTLYAGDTLFAGAFGRTDFPGGDARLLRQSLDALMRLPDETVVYPGHDESTTIRQERSENPYRGYLG